MNSVRRKTCGNLYPPNMKRPSVARAAILALLSVAPSWLPVASSTLDAAEPAPIATEAAPADADRVVAAANAFLGTLDEKQRARVSYRFDDQEQRARWSNFPTGVVPRGGISLHDMSEGQRTAAMALVAAVLSPRGLEKVQQIMEADEAFKNSDHKRPPRGNDQGGDHGGPPFGSDRDHDHGGPPFGGGRPGGPGGAMFGKDLYYISILGAPSAKDPWILQYGGHHLALNIAMVGGRGVITPTLTGSQPATFTTADGKTVRPLGQENDKGFALLKALDETQRKQAILNYRVADLVLGPGHDGQTIQPEGLKVSAMDDKQRALLLDLISEWSGIVNDQFAAARMEEIKAGLDDTWFAWSGPTAPEPGKKNGTAYYRIQGPKLVIEFAPQHEEDHVHTMYRDPSNDYGRALTAPK